MKSEPKLSRLLISTIAWLVFVTSLILLVRVISEVGGQGGTCASGGPYQIVNECSSNTLWFGTITPWLMIFAVLVQGGMAKGWGPSLPMLFWPALFCTLGGAFFTVTRDEGFPPVAAIVVGGMFMLMGGLPLVLILIRASRQTFSIIKPGGTERAKMLAANLGKQHLFADDPPVSDTRVINLVAGVLYLGVVVMVSIVISNWLWWL